jgi:hypothetical protein
MANPDYTEDTEWNDILRQKGIIPEITTDQLDELIEQTIQNYDPLERATLAELKEFEDLDLEDDRIIQQYRQQRLKEFMHKKEFGTVREMSKTEYKQESSSEKYVIILLYNNSNINSNLIERELKRLAVLYKESKIIKIKADMCIENYPDKNVPTLIIYKDGDVLKNVIALTGKDVAGLEEFLLMLGALHGYKQEVDDYDDLKNAKDEDTDSDFYD